jgi:hypothetical protein
VAELILDSSLTSTAGVGVESHIALGFVVAFISATGIQFQRRLLVGKSRVSEVASGYSPLLEEEM